MRSAARRRISLRPFADCVAVFSAATGQKKAPASIKALMDNQNS